MGTINISELIAATSTIQAILSEKVVNGHTVHPVKINVDQGSICTADGTCWNVTADIHNSMSEDSSKIASVSIEDIIMMDTIGRLNDLYVTVTLSTIIANCDINIQIENKAISNLGFRPYEWNGDMCLDATLIPYRGVIIWNRTILLNSRLVTLLHQLR